MCVSVRERERNVVVSVCVFLSKCQPSVALFTSVRVQSISFQNIKYTTKQTPQINSLNTNTHTHTSTRAVYATLLCFKYLNKILPHPQFDATYRGYATYHHLKCRNIGNCVIADHENNTGTGIIYVVMSVHWIFCHLIDLLIQLMYCYTPSKNCVWHNSWLIVVRVCV